MIEIPQDWTALTNTEIAKRLGVTPTAILYAKRRLNGECERCGKHPATHGRLCARHAKAIRNYHRKKRGHRPWKPGGVGRPPINRQEKPL